MKGRDSNSSSPEPDGNHEPVIDYSDNRSLWPTEVLNMGFIDSRFIFGDIYCERCCDTDSEVLGRCKPSVGNVLGTDARFGGFLSSHQHKSHRSWRSVWFD